ncbi:MAG: hypothetical protein LLG16_04480 [Euryarchaeota archaeon]|nr:hypothetical protein [Euryarchaeota archaeon]
MADKVFDIGPGWQAIYALFFVWTAFVISLMGKWPLTKVKQPLVGIAFLIAALIIGILHPFVVEWLGYDKLSWAWPLISNLFLAVGIVVAFGNMFVEGLKQPASIAMNSLFMYIFAIITLLWIGMVPAIWFAFFVFVIFWMEGWPVQNMKQPAKGIMLMTIMGFFALILWYLFIEMDTHFFNPDAGLWFVIFVWWLVSTSWTLETWPLQKVKQPLKAIGGLVISVVLTFITYYVISDVLEMNLGDAGMYVWVFVSWLYSWDILFGKWPAERAPKVEKVKDQAEVAKK